MVDQGTICHIKGYIHTFHIRLISIIWYIRLQSYQSHTPLSLIGLVQGCARNFLLNSETKVRSEWVGSTMRIFWTSWEVFGEERRYGMIESRNKQYKKFWYASCLPADIIFGCPRPHPSLWGRPICEEVSWSFKPSCCGNGTTIWSKFGFIWTISTLQCSIFSFWLMKGLNLAVRAL